MDAADKQEALFEVDEIFKYKDLIDRADRDVIKEILHKDDDKAGAFYSEFKDLVIKEVDHTLNKAQFAELRDELIANMKSHLGQN